MIVISKEQIIDLHKQLIEETGGSHGLRDEGLLDSASGAAELNNLTEWILNHQL